MVATCLEDAVLEGRSEQTKRRRTGLIEQSKHPHVIALLRRGLQAAAQRPDSARILSAIVAKVVASQQSESFKRSFIAEVVAIRAENESLSVLERGLQAGLLDESPPSNALSSDESALGSRRERVEVESRAAVERAKDHL